MADFFCDVCQSSSMIQMKTSDERKSETTDCKDKTYWVIKIASTVLQSSSSMNGRDAIPLYAGWTPASQTIVRPRYCRTQHDRPTSWPAPSSVTLNVGASDMRWADNLKHRQTTCTYVTKAIWGSQRSRLGVACKVYVTARAGWTSFAISQSAATCDHSNRSLRVMFELPHLQFD